MLHIRGAQLIGSGLIVPLLEKLAFREYLLRKLAGLLDRVSFTSLSFSGPHWQGFMGPGRTNNAAACLITMV